MAGQKGRFQDVSGFVMAISCMLKVNIFSPRSKKPAYEAEYQTLRY